MDKPKAHVEFYQDGRLQWRWRVVARNGKILSASTESYKRKRDCVHCLRLTKLALEQEVL